VFVKDVDLEAMPTSIFLNDDNDDYYSTMWLHVVASSLISQIHNVPK